MGSNIFFLFLFWFKQKPKRNGRRRCSMFWLVQNLIKCEIYQSNIDAIHLFMHFDLTSVWHNTDIQWMSAVNCINKPIFSLVHLYNCSDWTGNMGIWAHVFVIDLEYFHAGKYFNELKSQCAKMECGWNVHAHSHIYNISKFGLNILRQIGSNFTCQFLKLSLTHKRAHTHSVQRSYIERAANRSHFKAPNHTRTQTCSETTYKCEVSVCVCLCVSVSEEQK